jgi:MFS family permease
MNFDALKNEWQQQQAPEASLRQSDHSLSERLRKAQRKLLVSNISGTLGMIVALGGISWGWLARPEGNTGYLINLLMVTLLIMVSLVLMWMRLLFWKKPDFSLDSQTFIRQTLRRLKRTPWITRRFIPVYSILLFVLMAYHTFTTLASASTFVRLSAVGGLLLYFVVVYIFSMRHHRRKQKKEIEPLIRELEEITRNLTNE